MTTPLDDRIFCVKLAKVIGRTYSAQSNWRVLSFENSPFPLVPFKSVIQLNPVGDSLGIVDDQEYPFVSMDAVNPEMGMVDAVEMRKGEDLKVGYTQFRNGDVLFAKISPCLENGKSFIAGNLPHDLGFGSTEFNVFRVTSPNVIPQYVHALLRLDSVLEASKNSHCGTTGHQRIISNFYTELDIPLPPLPVQRKIVAELDAAYAAKRKADREAAALLASIDDMVLSELGISTLPPRDTSLSSRIFTVSLKEVCGGRLDPYYYQSHFRELTRAIWKDERTCRLGSIGDFVRGVVYSSEDETDNGHSILRANNISLEEMELDLSDLVYVGDSVEFNPLQKIRKGDILICAASGSKEHAGKVAYVHEDIPDTYIGGFMTALRVRENAKAEYVSTYMQSSLFRNLIYRHLGGTNINNISLELLNKLPLILPDMSVQERIVRRAAEIKAKAKELKSTAATNLATAKKRIEAELMGDDMMNNDVETRSEE